MSGWKSNRVIVIGAGIGGLSAAVDLARQGLEVVVLEKAAEPGGKIRSLEIDGARIDSGPTVFTMRWVFEEIFADAGAKLSDRLALRKAEILARHAWSFDERLDIFADANRSIDAISAFSGAAEGRRYAAFCEETRRIYDALERSFIRAQRPGPLSLVGRSGFSGIGGLRDIHPFSTMWSRLARHFQDPRLRQLFGRYATYCGSSPFRAPATLMLVAHVEREGVWLVEGGMRQLAVAMSELAGQLGARFRYDAEVRTILVENGRACGVMLAGGERLEADAVVLNADVAALAAGLFGTQCAPATSPPLPQAARSLSAVTWTISGRAEGFPLVRHNVLFSSDYEAEFNAISERRALPFEPTIYVCAQDRDDRAQPPDGAAERLLVLVNAPPTGDIHCFDTVEISQCEQRTFQRLERCGLCMRRSPQSSILTTPRDFERLFPATGGALYGRASHGWMASFQRPGSRSNIPRLYIAGGSAHPGPGVPMAALSGRLAAASLIADCVSTSRSRPKATTGGILTR